jgi:hypothetical protein
MKKKLNYKVVNLDESYNFDVKFIFIRVYKKSYDFLKRGCPTVVSHRGLERRLKLPAARLL